MANKPNALPFNFGGTEDDATLIPAGSYNGTIAQAKFVTMPDGTDRLWLGIRITGPKQSGRFITTLCPLSDAAKSAYKTKALVTAVASQLGEMYLPADPETFIDFDLIVDIVEWTPRGTGVAVNDIRTFKAVPKTKMVKPAKVKAVIDGLTTDLELKAHLKDAAKYEETMF